MCSKVTACTDNYSSSDESMPDLTTLNVAVPIPVKPSRRHFAGISNGASFLSECAKGTRAKRFLSHFDVRGMQSPQGLSIVNSGSSEEKIPSPLITLGQLAQIPEFRSFSLFSQTTTMPNSQGEKAPVLNDLIERFLQNRQIREEEVIDLNKGEKLVLDCLIRRKLKIGVDDYVNNYQNIDYGLLKVKRLEENYKMVFKSALKHLGNMFKKTKKGKKGKADDTGFYEHYFGNIADEHGVPLETFFHPNKKMKGSNKKCIPNQKTMNSKYLDNLLSSPLFRQDLDIFLDMNFLCNYTSRRRKKIDNLVEKLKKKFLLTDEQDSLSELTDYLQKNSKCKLPWSNYELQLAQKSVKQLLNQKATTQRSYNPL